MISVLGSLGERLSHQSGPESLGLYVHIPFCQARCHFCAFYIQVHREERVQQFLSALGKEINLYAKCVGLARRRISTVYFGGGTPTSLHADELCRILTLIKSQFYVEEGAEISVEAHPKTVSEESLSQLLYAGFNRISFGAQSFADSELSVLGRRTIAESTHFAVRLARAVGFRNINLDLMYGLPGQSLESWQHTVQEALELDPVHLSGYALTIEEGTRFEIDLRRGDLKEPDPNRQNMMEDVLPIWLAAHGFMRYEISNFSKPGYACRHNLRYWEGNSYLGLGPSAQSYICGIRFGNVEDLHQYSLALQQGKQAFSEVEFLSPRQVAREKVVFGLRRIDGVDLNETLGLVNEPTWLSIVQRLVQDGLLSNGEGHLKLTDIGCRYADSVSMMLL